METSADRTARPGPTHPPPATPPHDDAHTGGVPRVVTGRRRTVLLVLAAVAVLSAAALVVGLLTWAPERAEQPRALTADERERLAAMRVTNYRDLRAGVRVTAGAGGARTELVGWVDWSRPMVYLDVGGPGAGAERGLLQATPTVALLRPDPTAVPTPAPPPLVPPTERWRLHDPSAGRWLAAVLDLVFRLATDRPDPPADAARRVGGASVGAAPVDILQAPPPGPGASAPPPSPDGHPRYWLDHDARLHRLETVLAGAGPVTVQLNRADRPTLRPVDALGGRPGQPRALSTAERGRLDRLPARLRARGGAAVTLTAPVATVTNLRGAGWVSWGTRTAYVAVADLGVPDRRTLLRVDGTGASRADVPATTVPGGVESPGRPPLPPPAEGWRADPRRAGELGLLLDAALRAAGPGGREAPRRIRGDTVAGRTVDVVELRTARGPLRYWIDRSGELRRLERRTRVGAWAQLDLTPDPVPRLVPAPRPPVGGR
ncbi:hypothetical protein [Micromonospora echinofusca]|uniref:Uncharacterized protein n=1 Tax=Micromonospora echinofusca TaxID=47858 RepID=A0A1C5G688_MICEH|nr:hypothetical protein [Micromonospora echinofusca]SCG15271.1 hypothetical protein GA0070610_1502 [Micromonospora echinofusca]